MELSQYLITHQSCNGINLEIPTCQRNPTQSVIDNMVEHAIQRIKIGKYPIFGVIDVAILNTPFGSCYYIADGQHRYSALKKLYSCGYTNIPIHIMYYVCSTQEDVKEVFNVRNLNVIIPEYIISSSDKRLLLDEIYKWLKNLNPIFCEKKTRPYIYLPDFINKLSDSLWFKNIHNLNEFKAKINIENSKLQLKLNNNDFIRSQTISSNMISHWNLNCIWLGVDKYYSWMSEN